MPLTKPWEPARPGDPTQFRGIPGTLGVYEISDESGAVIYIGKADPRVAFGLRQAIGSHFESGHTAGASAFRYEVTSNYYSRWIDLLTRYAEDYDRLPPANSVDADGIPRLGRFHWKSPTI